MIPRLKNVFIIREVNVTTLVNQFKVPAKFAEYVNEKDRKFADVLMKFFFLVGPLLYSAGKDYPKRLNKDDPPDAWQKNFDEFWRIHGEEASKFLNKNPTKKNLVSQENLDQFYQALKEFRREASEKKSEVAEEIRVSDNFVWVNLKTSNSRKREGELMQNCGLVDDFSEMWSLRDPQDKPHVDIEIDDGGVVVQCKGKQNKDPDRKYWKYIEEFCRKKKTGFGTDVDINDPEFSRFVMSI